MRVLVITRAPWRNDNNTGNTLTAFFRDMKNVEFCNLYFREQLPKNDVTVSNFAISEGQLIKNLVKKTPVGKEVVRQDTDSKNNEESIYQNAKRFKNTVLSFIREIIWMFGNWKSESFIQYLEDKKPDVIFMPVFNCFYPHKILQFVKKQTGAKVILFHADDNYTLKQFSISPLYWIYRFNLRKWVRRSVEVSDENYVISDIQKRDYEKAFKTECKILTKGKDFSGEAELKSEYNSPLQLVYTGNIGVNRWKSLEIIANALEEINRDGIKAQLRIYTGSPMTSRMSKALNKGDSSIVMGFAESEKIQKIQSDADILVHVEAFDMKNKLLVRQSFSTKLVDYMKIARPIIAVGPDDVASISHLINNKCAIVAENKDELKTEIIKCLNDRSYMDNLVKNAYECGKKYHDKTKIYKMLSESFNK